jgi:hypothetical protein
VFDDVGLKDYSYLQTTLDLLKATTDEFADASRNKPVRIVSAVSRMRGI